MVVENEPGTAGAQDQSDEEQQIRRIACVHDVDRALATDLYREPQRMPQRHSVFPQIAHRPASRRPQRISQDADAFDHRFGFAILLGTGWADDSDPVTRVDQCATLLPDPAVERHREVLHEDQYVAIQLLTTSSIAHCALATLWSRSNSDSIRSRAARPIRCAVCGSDNRLDTRAASWRGSSGGTR